MADLTAQLQSIIDTQVTTASSASSEALSVLRSSLGGGIRLADIDTSLPTIQGVYNLPVSGLPAAPFVDYNFGTAPKIPSYTIRDTNINIDTGNAPTAPTFLDRPSPEISIPDFGGSAPVVDTNFTIPDSPILRDFEFPAQITVDIPDAPTVTIADYNGINAEAYIPGTAPDGRAEFTATYDSVLPEMRAFLDGILENWITQFAPEYYNAMAKLEAKIARGIDGGTAMSDVVEQQIFDRARDRAEAEKERAVAELLDGMTRRGYEVPPSALSAGLTQIEQTTSQNISAVAAETAIARAKLEQEHAEFIMTLSSSLHQGLLNTGVQYAGQLIQINGQALDYSKEMAGLAVERYNQELEKLKSVVAVAQTQAAVYEAQLKASLADITIFEAEIRAAELQKNIEKIDIDAYKARIDAEQSKIQTYLAQIEGVKAQVDIEKTKVEVFGEEVNAYVAQVQASLAGLEVFKAAVDGDEAKARLFAAQVQAYSANIDAEKAKAEVEVDLTRIDLSKAEALLDAYKAELAAYVAEAQTTAAANDSQSTSYAARIEAYKAERTVAIKNIEAQLSVNQLQAQTNIASMEARARTSVAQADIVVGYHTAMVQAGISAGNAYASLAGSAMSGTNAIVSLSQEGT